MKQSIIFRLIAFITLFSVTIILSNFKRKIEATSESGVYMQLTNNLPNYRGIDREASEIEKDILPNDTKFLKKVYISKSSSFSNDDSIPIQFSLILGGADRRSLHRPEVCLVAQGWSLKNRELITFDVNGKKLRAVHLTVERTKELAGKKQKKIKGHYIYWWVGKNISTPHTWKRILLTSWDNAFKGINHRWAYPSIMYVEPEILSNQFEVKKIVEPFIKEAIPLVQKSFSL